jgi:hypothetical protein
VPGGTPIIGGPPVPVREGIIPAIDTLDGSTNGGKASLEVILISSPFTSTVKTDGKRSDLIESADGSFAASTWRTKVGDEAGAGFDPGAPGLPGSPGPPGVPGPTGPGPGPGGDPPGGRVAPFVCARMIVLMAV